MEIQNGCDHSCTFCIIPQGRGPSRSVPAGLVVTKVRELADKGCKEVVLTGVDITSYGTGLPGGMTLGALVRSILKRVPHLPRLRLSSIDTIEADEVLIRAFAEEDRLMPHVHLSLQSGDDLILKRMKRRHCRADAIAFCENLRKLRPDIVFGADLIAGFPTEDDAMFGNTLRLADDCGLSFLHVFPFSPRPGTPAARMPQVNRNTVKSRAAQLREKGRLNLQAHFDRQKGRLVNALVEREGMARSPDFSEIHFKEAAAPGEIITARVTGSLNGRLTAMRVA
jgi:threonylcarbamoyladenosine tRNA methylthiotransferase MtaB